MKRSWLLLLLVALGLPALLEARWIQDKVVMDVPAIGEVEFSHYSHMEAVGKNCPTCHNEIFHIVTEKNPAYTMDQMEEGKSCGACHNGERAFTVEENCTTCHPTRDLQVANKAAPAFFSHDVHTSMFGCSDCHPDLFTPRAGANDATMAQMRDGASCGACHDGSTAFSVADNCGACHPTRDIPIEDEAAPAFFSHDVHTSMFGCSDCHPGLFLPEAGANDATMAQMRDGASCGACHDGGTAFSVTDNCSACHPTQDVDFQTDAGEVVFSHDVHTSMFGCSDCHPGLFLPGGDNPEVSMDEMAEGLSCGACHDGSTAFSVTENCDACHQM